MSGQDVIKWLDLQKLAQDIKEVKWIISQHHQPPKRGQGLSEEQPLCSETKPECLRKSQNTLRHKRRSFRLKGK